MSESTCCASDIKEAAERGCGSVIDGGGIGLGGSETKPWFEWKAERPADFIKFGLLTVGPGICWKACASGVCKPSSDSGISCSGVEVRGPNPKYPPRFLTFPKTLSRRLLPTRSKETGTASTVDLAGFATSLSGEVSLLGNDDDLFESLDLYDGNLVNNEVSDPLDMVLWLGDTNGDSFGLWSGTFHPVGSGMGSIS